MKYYVGLVAVAVVALGGLFFMRPVATPVSPSSDTKGQAYGAVTTNIIDDSNITIGGVNTYYRQQSLLATSSVLCAIKAPSATSSITGVGVKITNNSLPGTNVFYISTSTSAVGSSTVALIGNITIATSTYTYWEASGQTGTAGILGGVNAQGATTNIIGPNQWITVRIATTTPGTVSSGSTVFGTCNAIFTII